MDELDYNRILELFDRYHSRPTFDVNVETHNIGFAGTAMQYQMHGPTTVTMNAVFRSAQGFNQFAKDILRLDEMADEEYLRRHNPTLMNAYEEYQLLLKLTR